MDTEERYGGGEKRHEKGRMGTYKKVRQVGNFIMYYININTLYTFYIHLTYTIYTYEMTGEIYR